MLLLPTKLSKYQPQSDLTRAKYKLNDMTEEEKKAVMKSNSLMGRKHFLEESPSDDIQPSSPEVQRRSYFLSTDDQAFTQPTVSRPDLQLYTSQSTRSSSSVRTWILACRTFQDDDEDVLTTTQVGDLFGENPAFSDQPSHMSRPTAGASTYGVQGTYVARNIHNLFGEEPAMAENVVRVANVHRRPRLLDIAPPS
jgi:hypothetical protein